MLRTGTFRLDHIKDIISLKIWIQKIKKKKIFFDHQTKPIA